MLLLDKLSIVIIRVFSSPLLNLSGGYSVISILKSLLLILKLLSLALILI